MATPSDDFDWTAAEADVSGAEVIDLNKRRWPDGGGFSADIDDERDEIGDEPVPVDPPECVTAWPGARATRRPIVPKWLRSRMEALALARWIAGHYTHVTGYHLTRMPLYAGRLMLRAPRGLTSGPP